MRIELVQEIERLCRETRLCAKCGKCKSVCPVFLKFPHEAGGARGKIALTDALLSGKLEPSRRLEEYLQRCLLCTRCSEVCPSGVDCVRLIRGVRALVGDRLGRIALARIAMRTILPKRGLLDLGLRTALRFQRASDHAPTRHLPLFVLGKAPVPELARRTALSDYAGTHGVTRSRGTVCLFLGCLINYVYPRIAGAFIRLAQRAGFEVIVPPGQLCCGTPALSLGEIKLAKTLARRNFEILQSVHCDYIVTACASCARTLMREYDELLGGRFVSIGKRILEASQFLVRVAPPLAGRLRESVTYHDPCHLYYGLAVRSEPRELLARHSNFVELDSGGACCGLGGAFAAFFPELARSIGTDRIQAASRTGARTVASACPGCMLQLASCTSAERLSLKVKHVIEIAEEAVIQADAKGGPLADSAA